MGEWDRVRRLMQLFASDAPDVAVGIGDDAAVLGDGLVLSVDASIEGTHFERRFGSLRTLARRAVVAALSDLAAMGASARAILVSLEVPSDVHDEELDELHRGVADAGEEVGAPIVGGNLAKGARLALHTTVVGATPAPLLRSGARAGDGLYLTGATGAAPLGLASLLADRHEFADSWLRPRAHLEEGIAIRPFASAAIDVSDGLLSDVHHLCGASGVGAVIEADALPEIEGFVAAARSLGCDPLDLSLAGGESYVVLFAAADRPPVGTRIGTLRGEPGVFVRIAGELHERGPLGFDHFA